MRKIGIQRFLDLGEESKNPTSRTPEKLSEPQTQIDVATQLGDSRYHLFVNW